ncbi:hypothetical protein AFLA_012719 [Aspergillus flavus NRRL3357]|nr:hypothetical protein AFLA_012719 [Aspergillus flavus NRRL3357]
MENLRPATYRLSPPINFAALQTRPPSVAVLRVRQMIGFHDTVSSLPGSTNSRFPISKGKGRISPAERKPNHILTGGVEVPSVQKDVAAPTRRSGASKEQT